MTIPTSLETMILQNVMSILGVLLASCITYLTARAKRVIDSHLSRQQAEMANTVLNGLSAVANAVVNDFDQRIVQDTKNTGEWNTELGRTVKRDAISAVKTQAPALCNLGQTALGDIDQLIGTMIEDAIRKRKSTL